MQFFYNEVSSTMQETSTLSAKRYHTFSTIIISLMARLMLAAVIIFVSLIPLPARPALAMEGSIAGIVTDEAGTPLAGITIELYQEEYEPSRGVSWSYINSTQSNSDGTYTFSGLVADTYRIGFFDWNEPIHYRSEYYADAAQLESATDIVLSANQAIADINIRLVKLGSISGRVSNQDGQFLANISVMLYIQRSDSCCQNEWYYDRETYTDSEGRYKFERIDAGTYRMGFSDANEPSRYQREFYDNATVVEAATDIVLSDSQELTDIDIQLAKVATISGRVSNSDGQALSNIQVTLYRKETDPCCTNDWYSVKDIYSDSNGNYLFSVEEAGTYRIGFADYDTNRYQPEFYDNAANLESATDIIIASSQDVTGIDVQLDNFATISVRVTNPTGDPLSNIEITLYHQSPDSCCPDEWYSINNVYSDGNGNYTFNNVTAGTYRVGFIDYNTYTYQPEYYDDAPNVESATDILVAKSQSITGIDAQLGRFSTISGRVTNPDGEPLTEVYVILYQNETDPCCPGWQHVNSANTDANGHYTIQGVAGGTYRVGFEHDTYQPEYYDNAADIESATDVTVVASQDLTNIDAQLATYGSISGQVTSAEGPMAEIAVTLYRKHVDDTYTSWHSVRSANTNDSGEYMLNRIDAGTYRVGFYERYGTGYLEEYYDNAFTIASATDIVVASGEQIKDIDAHLEKKPQISGRVTNGSGQGLEEIEVIFYYFEKESEEWVENGPTAWTRSDGSYSIGLIPNTYRVKFVDYQNIYGTRYYTNASSLELATDMVLAPGQVVDNINAILKKRTSISGQVVDSAGKTLSNIFVGAYRRGADTRFGSQSWVLVTSAVTDDEGRYTIYDLPADTYRVGFTNGHALYKPEFYDSTYYIGQASDIIIEEETVVHKINAQLEGITLNVRPFAVRDSAVVAEGSETTNLQTAANSVLANDEDAEDASLTAHLVTPPDHGTLTLNDDGTFTYIHDGSETTSDLFVYQASDGAQMSDAISVTISITPTNDAPMAVSDALTVAEGSETANLQTAANSVLANDEDAEGATLTAHLVTPPAHGTLTLNDDGTFTYIHDGSETTSDLFVYQASDGAQMSNAISVTISVTPTNDAPIAVDDALTVERGGSSSQLTTGHSVLENDSDVDITDLTVILVTQPEHGTVTLNPDGTFTYVHDGSAAEHDSFIYKASDGQAMSSPATVDVNVTDDVKVIGEPIQRTIYLPLIQN